MIELSRFSRNGAARAALVALLVVAAISVTSCNLGRECNGPNCDGYLTINFEGDLAAGSGWLDGGTVDGGGPADAIEIDVAGEINQTFTPIKKCWLTLGALQQVVCDDDEGRPYVTGGSFALSGSTVQRLSVTMSMNGTQIAQQTIPVTYVTQTCNGCGGSITVDIGTATIPLPPAQRG